MPIVKAVDAGAKPKIFEKMTLPALHWFRWSSVVTVWMGLAIWGSAYLGPDAELSIAIGGGLGIVMMFNVWASSGQ